MLNRLLEELHSRFSDANKKLLKSMSVLDPHSLNFLDLSTLKPMAEQYCVDVKYLDVELRQARRLVEKKKNEGLIVGSLVELSVFLSPYKEAFPICVSLLTLHWYCHRLQHHVRGVSPQCDASKATSEVLCLIPGSSLGVIGIHPSRVKHIDMEHFVFVFVQKQQQKNIAILKYTFYYC